MNEIELRKIVEDSLVKLLDADKELFVRDISERSIVARWMHHFQILLPEWHVDVEFNREGHGQDPKRLGLELECVKQIDSEGNTYATPDLIVHQRGPKGPNLFVAEVKKSTNRENRFCDEKRVIAFRNKFKYEFGAVIELETRANFAPGFKIKKWYVE